ncbi:MAG TPA: S24/S26 family peptidase [Ruminococcus sp.]
MNNSTFEDEIKRTGRIIYTNVGDSMMPLIKQGRDVLVISAVNGRLKRYDIPLYKRDSGQYVLHRILKVRKNDYVICGDNRCNKEYGITDRHIIGVLSGIIRDGREIPVTDIKCRIYAHLWCDLFPVRVLIIRIRQIFKRRLK